MYFRNPNKPTKVAVEWPEYTAEKQYVIAIDKDMSKTSVMDFYFAEKANFLLNVMPTVTQAIQTNKPTNITFCSCLLCNTIQEVFLFCADNFNNLVFCNAFSVHKLDNNRSQVIGLLEKSF